MALMVDIEKRLGSFHLAVKFEAENNVLALLGASGCGKSMTLKCIAGIETPDRGRIVLDGVTLFDSEKRINLSPQKRRVGYLFQQYALFPNMTVEQNIACGVRDRKQAATLVPEIIAAMRLEGMERKKPHQLSGGQQQRAALARILVNQPEVLLLDEPFSALDSHLRFQLESELRSTISRFGKTVLLVSHNRDEVFRLADDIAVMHDGSIETLGSKEQVFAMPRTRNGAMLTGCKNISPARTLGSRRICAEAWGLELETADDVTDTAYVGIRMHDVIPGESNANSFRCRITDVIENPFSVTVMLQSQAGAAAFGCELPKEQWHGMQGGEMSVVIPSDKILLLKE